MSLNYPTNYALTDLNGLLNVMLWQYARQCDIKKVWSVKQKELIYGDNYYCGQAVISYIKATSYYTCPTPKKIDVVRQVNIERTKFFDKWMGTEFVESDFSKLRPFYVKFGGSFYDDGQYKNCFFINKTWTDFFKILSDLKQKIQT